MDMKDFFELIDKFDSSELSEIRYKTNDERITLKKGHKPQIIQGGQMIAPYPPMPQQLASSDNQTVLSANTDARIPETTAPRSEDSESITAPIVGTFYRSAAPDSPPFAEEGSTIKSGDTLCIIEAMKVMNKLEADYDMQVVKIFVANGDMVEYGTPLFEVKRI